MEKSECQILVVTGDYVFWFHRLSKLLFALGDIQQLYHIIWCLATSISADGGSLHVDGVIYLLLSHRFWFSRSNEHTHIPQGRLSCISSFQWN